MKKIKIFVEKYVLQSIAKINPKLYSFLYYHGIRLYAEIVNFLKYGDKYFFYAINIENARYCNRKCEYCPNSKHETPDEYMEENVFKTIISQLKNIKYSGIVAYVFYGEPLVDKRLESFVEYANKELPKAVQVLYSNGDYLTEERAINLSNAGLDKFVITVHDKDPSKGIERLTPIKEKLSGKMILTNRNEIVINNRAGNVDVSKYDNGEAYQKCGAVLTPVVTLNGDVLLCCQDYYREHVMGNIMEENIVNIWSGKYKKIREDLLAHDKASLPMCKKCLNRE